MYELIYASEAANDLQAIYDYIAKDNAERAASYMHELGRQILKLKDFPNIGHDSNYGELKALCIKILTFDDYLVFYTVNEKAEKIAVVRVLHGSVDYKRLF